MLTIKKEDKNVKVDNKEIQLYTGGFEKGQPCVLVDDVAYVYGITIKHLNETIRNNMDMFNSDDMFDLYKQDPELSKKIINDYNKLRNSNEKVKSTRRNDLFVFSEQGYIKLVSLLKNSSKKKQVMSDFIENYFTMKEHLTNISKISPELFFDSLPKMCYNTCEKYFTSIVTVKNIDEIVPVLIARLKSISHKENGGGLSARSKMRLISCCANIIEKMKQDPNLKVYDVAKLDDYQIQLLNYRHTIISCSNAGYSRLYNETSKELKETKKLLEKTIEEKSIIEKPVANEENKYEDLLRSFKVYRNYLAKIWDMGMEEVCNDYYDLIPVKLPMAKDCIKQGYLSKFEYCYAHYPEDTKLMVNKMYKDCICNGYLERRK